MRILKFDTTRCTQCKVYGPMLEKYCEENKLSLESYDAETSQEGVDWEITAVPYTIFIHNDNIIKRMGAIPEEELDEIIETLYLSN